MAVMSAEYRNDQASSFHQLLYFFSLLAQNISMMAMYGNPLSAMDFAAMEKCEWRRGAALPSTFEINWAPPKKTKKAAVEVLNDEIAEPGEWIKKRETLASSNNPSTHAAACGEDASTHYKTPRMRSLSPEPNTQAESPLIQVEKNPRSRLSKDDFKLGMMIEAPLMEEDFMYGASLTSTPNNSQSEFSITPSHYGYIHTKLRKFVVVALFAQHYLAIPMYTHNGDGLGKKRNPNEFVSVMDPRHQSRNRSNADLQPLSDHASLVADMRSDTQILYPKTTLHLAYAMGRNYQLRVNHLGELQGESTKRLLGLFREYMMRGSEGTD